MFYYKFCVWILLISCMLNSFHFYLISRLIMHMHPFKGKNSHFFLVQCQNSTTIINHTTYMTATHDGVRIKNFWTSQKVKCTVASAIPCEARMKGKQHCKPFKKTGAKRAKEDLELVHFDEFGMRSIEHTELSDRHGTNPLKELA